MNTEWAPLWAVPVLPVQKGTSLREQVRARYPGRLEPLVLVPLRRIGAVALVPKTHGHQEKDLPVPGALLNGHVRRRRRFSHRARSLLRYSGRGGGSTDRGPEQTVIFHAPTSRGVDLYRFADGRLTDAWSAAEAPPEAKDMPGVPPKGRLRGRGLTAADLVHKVEPRNTPSYLLTILVLLIAVIARLTTTFVFSPATTDDHHGPSDGQRAPIESNSDTPVVQLMGVTSDLENVVALFSSFHLSRLEINPSSTVVRFATDESPAHVMDHLNTFNPGPKTSWNHAVYRESGTTRVTLEIIYE